LHRPVQGKPNGKGALSNVCYQLGNAHSLPEGDRQRMRRNALQAIDAVDEEVPAQTHFIQPGGHEVAAALHVARTTCRTTERRVVRLAREEPVRPTLVAYVNRLGDTLFALARLVNHRFEVAEPIWDPSARASGGGSDG